MSETFTSVEIAVIVTCCLSIIGSLFIIVSFFLSREFRKSQSRKLLVLLSFCDMITAVAYLLYRTPRGTNDAYYVPTICKAQSFVNIFANQASFFWTAFISLFLFLSRKTGVKTASKYIPIFHIISWGWPIISAVLVAVNNVWGPDFDSTAYWCWISEEVPGGKKWLWHLVAGKAVEWSSCAFVTIMYIFVFIDLRKNMDQSPATQLLITHRTGATSWKSTEKKLLAIPFIFIVLRAPGTIRTIFEWGRADDPISKWEWLSMLQAIGDSGQGFANGLLFGLFTEKVRSFYRKLIASCSGGRHGSSLNFYGTLSNNGTEYYPVANERFEDYKYASYT